MTEEELKILADAIHQITYVVPGNCIGFTMEFGERVAHVSWDGDKLFLDWTEEIDDYNERES